MLSHSPATGFPVYGEQSRNAQLLSFSPFTLFRMVSKDVPEVQSTGGFNLQHSWQRQAQNPAEHLTLCCQCMSKPCCLNSPSSMPACWLGILKQQVHCQNLCMRLTSAGDIQGRLLSEATKVNECLTMIPAEAEVLFRQADLGPVPLHVGSNGSLSRGCCNKRSTGAATQLILQDPAAAADMHRKQHCARLHRR
jgi:hypothetical protein